MVILPALLTAQRTFISAGFIITNCVQEAESHEYCAYRFELNGKKVVFRAAKITPTKIGQFVTIWKRNENGPIMPFDMSDAFDFCVVLVKNGKDVGYFVFPKRVLAQQGYVSVEGSGGKRAMRVYPPWDVAESVQAQKTQAWQGSYFCEVGDEKSFERLKQLFE